MEAVGKGMSITVLLFLLSMFFWGSGILSFLFPLPLMLTRLTIGRRKAIYLFLFAIVLIVSLSFFRIMGGTGTDLAFLLISLYFPLSLSAAGVIWLAREGRGITERLMLSVIPSAFLALLTGAFILTDGALGKELIGYFSEALALITRLEEMIPGIDMYALTEVVLLTSCCFLIPMVMLGICVEAFIYECIRHSRGTGLEGKLIALEFRANMVWLFIISWALVLLLRFTSVSGIAVVVPMNIALAFTVLYAVEGFSVLYARVWRVRPRTKARTLFTFVLISMFIPGINLFVALALPLLGVLETFFDLKKIGGYYENHS